MNTADISNEQLRRYANSFMAFAADLHVPLGSGSGRFADYWAEFQRKDFEAMAPSLEAMIRGETPKVRRFMRIRTKGASKDSDTAIAILFLLLFCPRALQCQVGAYDQTQAGEVRYIVRQILNIDAPLNRLLASVVDVQEKKIVAHGETPGRPPSVLEILTTSSLGAHGSRPDVVWINELSHIDSEGFAQTCMDNHDKCPHGLAFICSNAGNRNSWQAGWRDIAAESDRWEFSEFNEAAPWISQADLEESQRRNPLHRFNRLWRGIWSTGEGDGINPADIAACTTLTRPTRRNSERLFLSGIDLGIKRDRSALVTVAVNADEGVVELANVQSWHPSDFANGEVDLNTVQSAVIEEQLRFGVSLFVFDPWQSMLLAQQLQQQGIAMQEYPFTSQAKDEMAKALLEAFRNQLIRLYPEPDLARDLTRLRIKEASHGGLRLDAVRDADGHADRAIALSIVLPIALEAASRGLRPVAYNGDDCAGILTPY